MPWGEPSCPVPVSRIATAEDARDRGTGARGGGPDASPRLPRLPLPDGGFATKAAGVGLFETVAVDQSLPLLVDLGRTRFGGHSLRVTGAQHLAAMGFPVILIQLLARWSSEVVLRYIREAPLLRVTAEYRRRHEEYSLERFLAASPAELVRLKDQCAELDARTAALLAAEVQLRSQLRELQDRGGP